MKAYLALAAALLWAPAFAETRTIGTLGQVPLVEALDTADLPAAKTSRFWFQGGDTAIGQHWLVPVIVIKGARPGPRLLLTAGIHGDELNGIGIIHRLVGMIDPTTLAGTLVAVPGLNPPGLLQNTREFASDDSRSAANLNREMPGDPQGNYVAQHAGLLWQKLLRPNADLAVDLHTQSRGTAYVLYAFASTAQTQRMAGLMAPDVLKLDRGEDGTVENELTRAGVPAITLELGEPGRFDEAMIARGTAGILNLMRERKMLAGNVVEPPANMVTGNSLAVITAPRGGWATLAAPLGSKVEEGQTIATMADAFGRVTDTLLAPRSGTIASAFTDPRRERGSLIVRIIWQNEAPECRYGCP